MLRRGGKVKVWPRCITPAYECGRPNFIVVNVISLCSIGVVDDARTASLREDGMEVFQ
jgi:hypothetical protein